MHKCFKCGIEFEGNFCPECGEKYLEEKICPKCGEKIDGSAKFCNSCGYSFIGDSYNHNKEKAPEKMEKLYNFITSFPSILFMILSVALMLLFLLPVAIMPGGEIMGEKIPSESYGNVYQLSNFDDTPFKGTLTILMVFGIIGLFIALIISLSNVFYKFKYKHITIANKKIFIKDIFTGIGYIIFFIIFILSCTLLGQISSFDEGMGVISGGLSPILTLVLTLISILLYGGSLVLKYYLIKKYPSLNDTIQDKINDSKPTKVETWLNHHKKLMVLFSGILVIAIAVSIIVPTILVNIHNGVYYEYNAETELYNKEKYYRLKGESWEDEEGNQGSIIFDGEDVTLSFELFGEKMELEGTIVKDVLKVNDTVFAKDNHEHKFDKWEVIDEGSCTELATEASDCPCGKHEIRKINQLVQHNFVNGKEATCADWGVEGTYCTLCGKLGANSQYIEPLHVKYYMDWRGEYGYCGYVAGISEECSHSEVIIPPQCVDKDELDYKTYPVRIISQQAFEDCSTLKKIVLPDTLRRIHSSAFKGCTSLEYISVPDSVTYINSNAFEDTPFYNKEENLDEYGVFYAGNHLIKAKNQISGAYSIKEGTKTITGSAFKDMSSLTTITIPEGVISIGDHAFFGCSSLTSIEMPNSVTSIGDYAFSNCTSLTSIVIPNSVTSIGDYAFSNCSSLTNITIPNSVTSIEMPNSVTSIGNYAFSNCSSLTSIAISNSVTSIGACAFEGCSSLTSIVIPNSVTSIGNYAFSNCSSLTSIVIPNTVTFIGSGAFYGCTSLTSIVIPNSVTSIERSAFKGCSSLTSIVIPNTVTFIGCGAFYGCTSLTSIVIPNSVTRIEDYAFQNCSPLIIYCEAKSKPAGWDADWKDSNVPVYWGINDNNYLEQNEVIYIVKDGHVVVARYTHENESNVVIPSKIEVNGVKYDVTSIGDYAFSNCSSLTSIAIPNSVTSIGAFAFEGCSSLTSIGMPNSVTSIGRSAFNGCSSLTSIEMPNSVTSIGDFAFSNCSSLTSIAIPNSVTSIGNYAFEGCSSLTSIVIPNNVERIGDCVFSSCSSLIIYCEAKSQPEGWDWRWNYDLTSRFLTVYWGGEWSYVDGVPTPND